MKKIKLIGYISLLLIFMGNVATAGIRPNIHYKVTFPEAQAHYVDVEMKIAGLNQQSIELKMPVWTPGSYLVREFSKNVESFTAWNGTNQLTAAKTSKNTWKVTTNGVKTLIVKYRVYAFEISVRTSFVDASHAFLSTSGIFLYPANGLHSPSTIKIVPYKGWDKVSTSLASVNGDQFTVTAPDYDTLFDSPIEVGNQEIFDFDVDGTRYEVAMYGGGTYNKDRLKTDMSKIIKEHVAMFGENPNKRYVFIVHNYMRGGGGLEHLSSTVLGYSRNGYSSEKGYQGFLELVSHEHFHLWNVKRLRPIALGPFDYENENYTTNLWIAEGFTAYFEGKTIRHAQLYPVENYLESLTSDINGVENSQGAKIQSAAESSFDAWIKYYRPNENSGNSTISYYSKGSIIAYLIDLEIINSSNGKYSLNDVMKYMYDEYYKKQQRGYTDTEFKQGIEKFAGKNFDDFYKKYVNGVEPVDHARYLDYAGYTLINELAGHNAPSLGIASSKLDNSVAVTAVSRGSSAWVSGINVNDEITAIDGEPVTDLAGQINSKKVDDVVNITLIRDGKQMVLPVKLLKTNRIRYKITPNTNATEKQLMVRKKWLKM